MTGAAEDDKPQRYHVMPLPFKVFGYSWGSPTTNFFEDNLKTANKEKEVITAVVSVKADVQHANSATLRAICHAHQRGVVLLAGKMEWTDPKTVCMHHCQVILMIDSFSACICTECVAVQEGVSAVAT